MASQVQNKFSIKPIYQECPHCRLEYKEGKRKEEDICLSRSTSPKGIKFEHNLHKDNRPKTFFGQLMVNYIIPQFENNVMSAVYFGAAFLVFIIGLRGIGTAITKFPWLPDFFIQKTEGLAHLNNNIVIIALLVEFSLILTMSLVMFFKPEDHKDDLNPQSQSTSIFDINIVSSLKIVKDFLNNEIKSPLIDSSKKKQVEEFLPIMEYYIIEESPQKEKEPNDQSWLNQIEE